TLFPSPTLFRSDGSPAASTTRGFISILRAVRLVPRVVTMTWSPSHSPDTPITCGLPPTSAVVSQCCPCFSSAASTSFLRCSADRVDVIAPVLSSRREMPRTLEAVALQRDLPTVLAPQAVDECGRRTHDADALDAFFHHARCDRLGRLSGGRRGSCIISVGAGQHRQLGEGREDEGLSRRQLGAVETLVVAGRGGTQAVVLRVARLHD